MSKQLFTLIFFIDSVTLRLANMEGVDVVTGRLEILHDDQWGTICDDSWSVINARVACRQLGYPGTAGYAAEGLGSDPIWLDQLMCSREEESLEECQSDGWGVHDCFCGCKIRSCTLHVGLERFRVPGRRGS